ncbi:4-carboxymuconolactone decarboxylase [Neorhizobium galegae]|uniref:carboxymuconolactone decarboxylase family protein n=1 Tax=Neorhizobium galegae TaxID=399 RepID=UPI00277ED4A5|nr:carboxymuconolactone decarboxylase family protein [Neorhizobium galegae]MDQ0137781.1 4-carboxymuconolactone decarboxylase [Neorhizobium galegae]
MTVFPRLDENGLNEAQKRLFDRVCVGGKLWPGPYNALARVPAIGLAMTELSRSVKAAGLSGSVQEVAILTVAAERRCSYGWHAHIPIALSAGVNADALRRLGQGGDPGFADAEFQQTWRISKAIICDGAGSAEVADYALKADELAVALVSLVGVYWIVFELVKLDRREERPSSIPLNLGWRRDADV